MVQTHIPFDTSYQELSNGTYHYSILICMEKLWPFKVDTSAIPKDTAETLRYRKRTENEKSQIGATVFLAYRTLILGETDSRGRHGRLPGETDSRGRHGRLPPDTYPRQAWPPVRAATPQKHNWTVQVRFYTTKQTTREAWTPRVCKTASGTNEIPWTVPRITGGTADTGGMYASRVQNAPAGTWTPPRWNCDTWEACMPLG